MAADMMALTVWQPWASLIILGAKSYEFRRWAVRWRFETTAPRRIVIHASLRPMPLRELRDLHLHVRTDPMLKIDAAAALPLIEAWLADPGALPLGAGLGTVALGQPVRCTELFNAYRHDIDERAWAWPVADPQRWDKPVPVRGMQGLWPWPSFLEPDGAA
jgi:hypothetical protein